MVFLCVYKFFSSINFMNTPSRYCRSWCLVLLVFLHSSCARRATARPMCLFFALVTIFFLSRCSRSLPHCQCHWVAHTLLPALFFSNGFWCAVCCYSVNYVAPKRRRCRAMHVLIFRIQFRKTLYIHIIYIWAPSSYRRKKNRLYLCVPRQRARGTDYVYFLSFFRYFLFALLFVCASE